jgi:hypothetical protein
MFAAMALNTGLAFSAATALLSAQETCARKPGQFGQFDFERGGAAARTHMRV